MSITDIIKLAKELGEALANSEEMRRLKRAEAAVEQNNEARTIFIEYQKAKFDNVKAQLTYKKSPIDFRAMEKKAMENPLVANLIKEQEGFNNLIKTINAIMAHSIEKTPVSGCFKGCGHDCGECTKGALNTTHGYTDDKTI